MKRISETPEESGAIALRASFGGMHTGAGEESEPDSALLIAMEIELQRFPFRTKKFPQCEGEEFLLSLWICSQATFSNVLSTTRTKYAAAAGGLRHAFLSVAVRY